MTNDSDKSQPSDMFVKKSFTDVEVLRLFIEDYFSASVRKKLNFDTLFSKDTEA